MKENKEKERSGTREAEGREVKRKSEEGRKVEKEMD